MPLNFPESPTAGQTSQQNGRTYVWNPPAWELVASPPSDSRWDLFLPTAPTGLTVTAGNAQASLAWTAPTGVIAQAPITDYREQFSTDGGTTWTTFTAAASTATTATITGLNNGTAVRFRVAAVNAVGVGAYTAASSSVTPTAGTPPNAPTSLTATAGNAQIALTWTAPSAPGTYAITGYTVEYTPSGGSAATVNTGSTSTSYTLTGLTNGTSHSVRVRAVSAAGNGNYSTAVTRTPVSVITLTATVEGAVGNFGDQSANMSIVPKEVAITDWRVTATTSWGHTYTNTQPHADFIDSANGDHFAYFRPNSMSSGNFLEIHHKPAVANGPVRIYLLSSRAPGVGTWTSNWQIDGYVGGVMKYRASFAWNFTIHPGD